MDYAITSVETSEVGYAYHVLITIACKNAGRRTWISSEVKHREPTSLEALWFDVMTSCDPSWDRKRSSPGYIAEEFLLPLRFRNILRAAVANLSEERQRYILVRYAITDRDDAGPRRSLRVAGEMLGVSQEAVRRTVARILPELYAFVVLAEGREDVTIRVLPRKTFGLLSGWFHDDTVAMTVVAAMTRKELLGIPGISLRRLSEIEEALRYCGLTLAG